MNQTTAGTELDITIPAASVALDGTLAIPDRATGIVVFAHGSGSSRHSPRNRQVAGALRQTGLATLLFDLLTEDEAATDMRTGHLRFDISRLGQRLTGVVDWLSHSPDTENLGVGLFGASTGAAAALLAAAARPGAVQAVVSRGGRPDLAGDFLERVQSPTLLIVGENDPEVLRLNRDAATRIRAEQRLEIVPGATHLFEEPGALEQVTRLAAGWFQGHLSGTPAGSRSSEA
jgi:dienelactone hydrolase